MRLQTVAGRPDERHDPLTLQRAQRLAFRLSLALLMLAAALMFSLGNQPRVLAADSTYAATPIFYGADTARMNASIAAVWPQYAGPYCGIATAIAAVNYNDLVHGVAMRFTSRSAQTTVAAANQTKGASRWGYATPVNKYAGKTNIAPDFGADPRSIAYMTYEYTPLNNFFHNYIYRWQFANSAPPAFSTQARQATTNVARALKSWHEPVNVSINGGAHSVLVSGMYSYNDPALYYPAQIASVVFRDPMFAPSVSRFQVDISTWTNGGLSTPAGVYSLWSLYYGDRYARGDGRNTYDPEPTVGIYKPTSAQPVHWYKGFAWIQRDNHYANGTYSPDYAYSSQGALLTSP
jgi:hypothetical protein